jgi:hypothetical protein
MDNHAHLLFKSGEAGRSTVMRKVLTWYAQYFKRRYRLTGHLFQCEPAGTKEWQQEKSRKVASGTRAKIARRGPEELGLSCAELARHLGVCASSISRVIAKTGGEAGG